VGFYLLTTPPFQFVAFYDAQRQMIVGSREIGQKQWSFVELPEKLGWDSHNYVTLAMDDKGILHLAGNMHCVPLIYYRTLEPRRIDTFQRVPAMLGSKEDRCTYPRFFRGPTHEFLFTYRDGSSGSGDQIYNIYNTEKREWKRLLDEPLTSGQGKMNAYHCGPVLGPDGYYHLSWVWRDHGGCESNHDLSYARSKDLLRWERSDAQSLSLPITFDTAEIVDPVPPKGGIINGNLRIGFDSANRVILSYHKFDEHGHTQIYNARREDPGWKLYQTSQWDYRWEFSGGGSIPFEIRLSSVSVAGEGHLQQGYSHPREGSGTWLLDENTLLPVGQVKTPPSNPSELDRPRDSHPHIQVKWCHDSGASGSSELHYRLRWETLGHHRDLAREGPLPAPSALELYCFKKRKIDKEVVAP